MNQTLNGGTMDPGPDNGTAAHLYDGCLFGFSHTVYWQVQGTECVNLVSGVRYPKPNSSTFRWCIWP